MISTGLSGFHCASAAVQDNPATAAASTPRTRNLTLPRSVRCVCTRPPLEIELPRRAAAVYFRFYQHRPAAVATAFRPASRGSPFRMVTARRSGVAWCERYGKRMAANDPAIIYRALNGSLSEQRTPDKLLGYGFEQSRESLPLVAVGAVQRDQVFLDRVALRRVLDEADADAVRSVLPEAVELRVGGERIGETLRSGRCRCCRGTPGCRCCFPSRASSQSTPPRAA